MEPRVSLSWYSLAVVAGLIALALGGHGWSGMWVAVGVAAVAAAMHGLFLAGRRAARDMPEELRLRRAETVPEHRRELDRLVVLQWASILVAGGGGATLLAALGADPFGDVGFGFDVVVVGWVVLWSGVYLSSLVDWYLILPKVSGISCPAPCERTGKQRWAGVTGLWSFHRGVARLLVPVVIVGCLAVVGAVSDDATVQAVTLSLAGVFTVLLVEFEVQGKAALHYGLYARRHVGDVVWLVRESEDWVRREPAYLVDIAAEGAKFKYVKEDGTYIGGWFEQKHDDDGEPVVLDKLNGRKRVQAARPPCADGCTGVNWYCYNNPRAYSQTTGSA